MSANVKEITVKYYPKYWSESRVKYLVTIGRLTEKEFEEITKKKYEK